MVLPSLIFRWNQNKTRLLMGVSLGLICLSVGLLGLMNAQKPNLATWQSATVAAPQELLRLVVRQNYPVAENLTTLKQIQVLPISTQSKPLYIFDFRSPDLCGRGGCLFAVYTATGKSVLRLLLSPLSSLNVPLFSVSSQTLSGYPCLVISQPISQNQSHQLFSSILNKGDNSQSLISQNLYCYSREEFTLFNHWITEHRS